MLHRTGYRSPWLVFSGAALVALLLYLPTVRYGFVWDDNALILNNPFLDRTTPIELLTKGFWNNPEVQSGVAYMSYYRPLTNLSLYVDRKVWGLRPAGYHLTNVAIHVAVVFLMSLLLWELFGSAWLAGLGGLLVGIHPATNCAVTWISDRNYLLALFFLLVSSFALLRGRRDGARVWEVLLGGSLLLSALALEASLAFAPLAVGWILLNRAHYRRLWAWVAATALPVAVYLVLRLAIARVPFAGSVVSQAIAEPLLVINTFGQQLQLLLFPFNQKVIYVPVKPFTGFSMYTVLGLLCLGLPLYAAIRLRRCSAGSRVAGGARLDPGPRRGPRCEFGPGHLVWYGYAWVVLFLLPFAHLVFFAAAGRMLYPAAPGLVILLSALYLAGNRRRLTDRVVFGVVVLYAVLFAVQTVRRNPVWRSDLSLSQAMVREAPGSASGHVNLGMALAGAGQRDEAIGEFRAALNIDPGMVEPRVGLAHVLLDQESLPAAIRELGEVVRRCPTAPRARNDLAVALMRNGQLDSAIAELREAVRLAPDFGLALGNLGYAYLASGDNRQAIAFLKAALRVKPDLADARASLAAAYRAIGMPDSAALVESGRW